MERQRKYDLVMKDDGTHELVDKSALTFEPTTEQLTFLERLFWDWEYNLNENTAIQSVGGQMSSLKRWQRDPAFYALYKNEMEKALGQSMDAAKMRAARAASGKEKLDKDERWAIGQLLKLDAGIKQWEMKLISIHNTQNNYYASVDMTDAKLKEIIQGGSADESGKALEAGTGKAG